MTFRRTSPPAPTWSGPRRECGGASQRGSPSARRKSASSAARSAARRRCQAPGKDRGSPELLAGKPPGGHDRAEHETVLRLPGGLARLAQVLPLVAVVLLIDSVLPQHVDRLVAEVVGGIGQFLDDPPARPSLSSLIVSTRLRCGDVVVIAATLGKCQGLGLRTWVLGEDLDAIAMKVGKLLQAGWHWLCQCFRWVPLLACPAVPNHRWA